MKKEHEFKDIHTLFVLYSTRNRYEERCPEWRNIKKRISGRREEESGPKKNNPFEKRGYTTNKKERKA